MIREMIFLFLLLIIHFLMAMSLWLLLMVFIFLNLSVLPEYVTMCQILMNVIYSSLENYYIKVFVIISLLKRSLNFITGIKILFLNTRLHVKKLIVSGINHPIFYGNVINKAKKLRHSPDKLVIPLNRLICKGYSYNIVVKSLQMVFFGVNIDYLIRSLRRI